MITMSMQMYCVYTFWLDSCKREKESYPRGLCWNARNFRRPPTTVCWVCDQRSSLSSSTAFAGPSKRFKFSNCISIRFRTSKTHVDCFATDDDTPRPRSAIKRNLSNYRDFPMNWKNWQSDRLNSTGVVTGHCLLFLRKLSFRSWPLKWSSRKLWIFHFSEDWTECHLLKMLSGRNSLSQLWSKCTNISYGRVQSCYEV